MSPLAIQSSPSLFAWPFRRVESRACGRRGCKTRRSSTHEKDLSYLRASSLSINSLFRALKILGLPVVWNVSLEKGWHRSDEISVLTWIYILVLTTSSGKHTVTEIRLAKLELILLVKLEIGFTCSLYNRTSHRSAHHWSLRLQDNTNQQATFATSLFFCFITFAAILKINQIVKFLQR